jgi:AcrR family transcriptional regulator
MATPPAEPRRNSLREVHAEQTRTLILDALARLTAVNPTQNVAIRDVAAAAGVAERTLYRHFPDRRALLDGLAERVSQQIGSATIEASLRDLDDLVAVIPRMFEAFDDVADLSRAIVILKRDPADPGTDHLQRTETFRGLVDRSFPGLASGDRRRLLAIVRALVTGHTWLTMREEFGLSGRESGQVAAWALAAMLAEVRRRGGIAIEAGDAAGGQPP